MIPWADTGAVVWVLPDTFDIPYDPPIAYPLSATPAAHSTVVAACTPADHVPDYLHAWLKIRVQTEPYG